MTVESTFRAATPGSAAAAERARKVMPGGDTRSATYFAPYPVAVERAAGPRLWDVDGREYIDLIGNYTSLVHGNAHPKVIEAATRAMADGTAYAAPCRAQVELAELIASRVPSVELLRYTNSGTEAAMAAMQLARITTGRPAILMARYGYHGSHEDTEIGLIGFDGPRTYVADFGDAASFEQVLAEHGDDIAAVFLEPVLGSGGVISAPAEFFATVAAAARGAGALVVLDEVITFRLAEGGAQSTLGVEPDVTMFGKLIGGGFPVGAIGGPREVLKAFDPSNHGIFHSGTYNGNPVTTAAGAEAVRLLTAEEIERIGGLGARLQDGLERAAADAGLPFTITRAGSLLNVWFSAEPPRARIDRTDMEMMQRFHLAALNHGLFFAPRGLLAVSTAHDEQVVDQAIERASDAMQAVAAES